MGIPMLPQELITTAFNDLLQVEFPESSVGYQENILKLKKYIRRQWYKYDPKLLSVHGEELSTNNGSESFHSLMKGEIKVHSPNCWSFVLTMNNILLDKAKDHMRMVEFGPKGFVRERRSKVVKNFERRRKAEDTLKLTNDHMAFWGGCQ